MAYGNRFPYTVIRWGAIVKRVYVREEVCMGCGLCRVYCQVQHSGSRDLLKAFKREKPLPRLRVERRGEVSFSLQCRHCTEPWCVYSCLTGAMQKDPATGVVTADPEKCIGCWTCVLACPNGALTRDTGNHRVIKCDLCPGEEMPVCVANCPNEALVFAEDGEAEKAEAATLAGKGV